MYRNHTQVEDREAKLDALHARLADAVGALTTEADWRRAIEFAARFRQRSFGNSMLIFVQHSAAYEAGRVPEPTPTYVAGYGQWRLLGRQVLKGQSGYMIFAPVTKRMVAANPQAGPWRELGRGERPDPGETVRTRLVGTRPAYVWDVSQTDGDPLPVPPAPHLLEGAAPAGLWDGLATQVAEHGFAMREVPDAAGIGGANGLTDYRDATVTVRADMDDAARAKTLAHELAHVMLHGPGNEEAGMHRGVAEVEAEAVALMTLASHDVDTSRYTVPYVAEWASSVSADPVQVVTSTFDRVRRTALAILDRLDTVQVGGGAPPGLAEAVRLSPAAVPDADPVVGVSL
ncbi:ArdC-like ssDNA-binding domain-containing protein [Xylanimonas protaetiae]|uniref:Serine/arginine repetitive matrix protein 2 n=1 Tax=Xylanimonas protaetiae TaxID=2509457 RepID=A0A4P6F021_9MICO|nr:ImmA/IrrE family metallo-endopeptidase [Xylanimonas protaetiae]QAY68792.1 serine/arginine repetitive matrix protein 2 [Xylanimonas protaetiae]